MNEFKLEIDKNTKYIKALRYLGVFIAGVSFFPLLQIILGSEPFDWKTLYYSGYGIVMGIVFFFIPENWFRSNLLITDEGIFSIPNKTDYWGRNKVYWSKIQSIALNKTHILLKTSVGSKRKIRLPIYTEDQWSELKNYLKEAAEFKGVEFS